MTNILDQVLTEEERLAALNRALGTESKTTFKELFDCELGVKYTEFVKDYLGTSSLSFLGSINQKHEPGDIFKLFKMIEKYEFGNTPEYVLVISLTSVDPHDDPIYIGNADGNSDILELTTGQGYIHDITKHHVMLPISLDTETYVRLYLFYGTAII
jgi:hypothetical protein